jgi:hypothetical protein
MYQEIEADSLKPIFDAAKALLETGDPVQITLNKHGPDFVAVLVQSIEPPI